MGSIPITSTKSLITIKNKTIKPSRRSFKPKVQVNRTRINEMIRISPVRLIDDEGSQVGIVATSEALELARSKDLDLVEISPTAKPPVCKIIDWGKHQYQESKKLQEAKTKQKKIEIKGVRFRPATDGNDLDFKMKQVEKFLDKGSKVKIEIVLRGREKAFANQSREKLQLFVDKIEIPIKIEQGIRRQFNGFNILITPNVTPNK